LKNLSILKNVFKRRILPNCCNTIFHEKYICQKELFFTAYYVLNYKHKNRQLEVISCNLDIVHVIQLTVGFDLSIASLTSSGSAGFNAPFAIRIAFTRAAASAAAASPHTLDAEVVAACVAVTDELLGSTAMSAGLMSHLLAGGPLSHLLPSGNVSHLLLMECFSRFAGTVSSLEFLSLPGPRSHLLDLFL